MSVYCSISLVIQQKIEKLEFYIIAVALTEEERAKEFNELNSTGSLYSNQIKVGNGLGRFDALDHFISRGCDQRKLSDWVLVHIKYRKNGSEVILTDGSHQAIAYDIEVIDDVYVVGVERNADGKDVPKYWKNGSPIVLNQGSSATGTLGILVQ
ncbi:hypothetical protein SAMN04488109_1747 [Chryseolinea serpens]|uniref:Uncharacterized protein n=1 Tax=Chryseolinea serpens TaxID=947013 RepID=A0A1M5MHE5_9BACT|nr:hypothetical protein [Chryseolinea serpens]SHG76740.1 hypothetical protein SAMN04488109_1747 [Chryseolinea serpens]